MQTGKMPKFRRMRDGQAVLRFRLDMTDTVNHASARSVDVVLLIDQETNTLSGYTSDWNLSGAACNTYHVEATEGRYGIDFTFPGAVQQRFGPHPGV